MPKPASTTNLERTINVSFRNKDRLVQSLTHRSATRKSPTQKHNERLEFLGDAVLELVATEYLFTVSDRPEGDLTSWRSALVKGEHLAKVGVELQLGKYLIMSRGEEASGGREKESTLANAVEALIGAIHLDQGYETVRQFCLDFIFKDLDEILANGRYLDEKSLFQEKAQEVTGVTPHYEVMDQVGPDHDKVFTCGVFIDTEKIAEGKGNSKQRAEQEAAKAGLKKKKWQ